MRSSDAGLMIATVLMAGLLVGCSRDEARSSRDTHGSTTGDTVASTTRDAPAPGAEAPLSRGQRQSEQSLPRMVDLGKGTCIPCKMMAPILEELEQEYEGRAIIEVIDLNEQSEAAREYAIRLIPTQIFFDSNGTEVWRHEGFLAKDAIKEKLRELGVEPVDQ
jgi:thioredoxin 1